MLRNSTGSTKRTKSAKNKHATDSSSSSSYSSSFSSSSKAAAAQENTQTDHRHLAKVAGTVTTSWHTLLEVACREGKGKVVAGLLRHRDILLDDGEPRPGSVLTRALRDLCFGCRLSEAAVHLEGRALERCQGCGILWYCGKHCAEEDRKRHEKECVNWRTMDLDQRVREVKLTESRLEMMRAREIL